jgi:putative hydrolase of the HAD superfamily
MVERLIFDLDDTLLKTGEFYSRQLRKFADKVTEEFDADLSSETVLEKQQEIDRQAIEEHGMAKHRFPESLARTWKWYCESFDRPVREEDVDECLSIGWAVYEDVPDPLSGMERTLDYFQDRHELILYTMGDPDVQMEKIRHHNLGQWFNEIHVVPAKDRDSLEPLVRPLPPDRVAIVGDSLRGEVKPALELGMLAVHRETDDQWHYHLVEVEEHYHTIRELPELMEVMDGRRRSR